MLKTVRCNKAVLEASGVMVPGAHYAVNAHGTIRSLAKKVSKKERNRLKKLVGRGKD